MSGYNLNSFNKNPSPKKPKPLPMAPGAIPSLGKFVDKQEAEKIKELTQLLNLFPEGSDIKKAAKKKLKKLFPFNG